jgi:PAS domain S-box-containing protein
MSAMTDRGSRTRVGAAVRVVICDRDARRRGEFARGPWPGGEITCCDSAAGIAGLGADVALVIEDDGMAAAETCRAARRILDRGPLVALLCPDAAVSESCDVVVRAAPHPALARIVLRSLVKLRAALPTPSERQAQAPEEEREDYFTLSPDLCCTIDAVGRFVDVNEAFAGACGIEPGTLVGLRARDLIHADDLERVEQALARLRGGNPLTDFETRVRFADGSWRWVSWSATPSPDRTAFYFIGRDVTRRHEEERRAAQANEDLARANTELERFAYAASHDLKEPLRMISSYLTLLQRRHEIELGTEGREFVAFCVDAAERLRVTLDTLLTYATSGTSAWKPAPILLRYPLKHALENLEAAISSTGAVVSAVGEPPIVMGNAVLLTLLFQNLVQNSLKYRSEARPEIVVNALRDGDTCTVSIADNGIGVAEDDLARIFESFQRSDRAGAVSGSGIGLATCKRIVERHGGRIWAESAPGAGTTVRFTLPIA